MRAKRSCVLAVLVVLAAALAACNMPGFRGATSDIGEVTDTPTLEEGVTPAYTETPITPGPTPTLEPGVTPSPTVCTYNAGFVEDVTVPDGTEVVIGTTFTKTWRLRSNGCLNWPAGTVLVFDHGEAMGGPATVPVSIPALGTTTDVSVTLTAPSSPGTYRGYWQLQAPDGTRFGPHIYVEIVAVQPTPTPTPETAPDLTIGSVTWTPDPPLAWEDTTLGVRVRNTGDAVSAPSTLHVVFEGYDEEEDIPSLAPGANYDVNVFFNAPEPGNYTLTLTVDAHSENREHNEGNNEHEEDFTSYRVTVRNWGGALLNLDECLDLDGGTMLGGCDSDADFLWRSEGAAGSTYHTLVPQNGARLSIYGTSEPDYLLCLGESLATANIDGGRTITLTGDIEPGDLPVGTYLCYETSGGLRGMLEVTNRGPFTVGYTNWELSDS